MPNKIYPLITKTNRSQSLTLNETTGVLDIRRIKSENFKPLVLGDFSVLKDSLKVIEILSFDFNVLEHQDCWIHLLKQDRDYNTDFTKSPWTILRLSCYRYHSDRTFQMSMERMKYISLNGWAKFVFNYSPN